MTDQSATAGFREFASIIGCKPSYVTELRKAGRLVLTDNGRRVVVADSIRLIEETRDPSKAGVAARHRKKREEASSGGGGGSSDVPAATGRDSLGDSIGGSVYQNARAVRERFLALAAKRDYEQSMGKLMSIPEIAAVASTVVVSFRSRMEAMAPQLAPQLAIEKSEAGCMVLLAEAIEDALTDLSREFTELSKKNQEAA